MRVTICFGGSTFNPKGIDIQILKDSAKALKELNENNHHPLVVAGGGNTARTYIESAKEFEVPHKILDQIGIVATRLNARLFISALGDLSEPEPIKSFDKAVKISLSNKIPVMGGTQPGHTTDAVAAKLADSSESDLLIFFTDVDGIYTADPKKNEEAEKIFQMKSKKLSDLMSKMEFEPGMTAIIDPLAAEILQGKKIKTLVLSKDEITRLPQIVEGSTHSGTTITPGDENA